jgi:hypothetical protein
MMLLLLLLLLVLMLVLAWLLVLVTRLAIVSFWTAMPLPTTTTMEALVSTFIIVAVKVPTPITVKLYNPRSPDLQKSTLKSQQQ